MAGLNSAEKEDIVGFISDIFKGEADTYPGHRSYAMASIALFSSSTIWLR